VFRDRLSASPPLIRCTVSLGALPGGRLERMNSEKGTTNMGAKRTRTTRTSDNPLDRCIVYARTSTVKQDIGIDVQLDAAGKWADYKSATIVATYTEQISGGKSADERAEFRKALDHAIRVHGTLVFLKLDRFGRTLRDIIDNAETLGNAGAHFVSIREDINTSSATGKLYFHLLGALSEWERDTIGERTSAALQSKKARGERVGKIPYGYRLKEDGRRDPHNPDRLIELERDPRVFAVLREIDRLSRKMSGAEIAEHLNARIEHGEDHLRPPIAGVWSKRNVNRARLAYLADTKRPAGSMRTK
jgi:DNA invertase Pin-like site-specific DNA recombinase